MAAVDQRGGNVGLRFNRGDEVVVTMRYADTAGASLDVSAFHGWEAAILDRPGGSVLASFAVDVSAAASGVVGLSLGTAISAAVSARSAVWYVRESVDATSPRTVLTGPVTVEDRGTRGQG